MQRLALQVVRGAAPACPVSLRSELAPCLERATSCLPVSSTRPASSSACACGPLAALAASPSAGLPLQSYAQRSIIAQDHDRCSGSVGRHYSLLAALSPGHRKARKRRARGGGDKQAGRGYNGQKSRSGTGKPALFFEGGQTPFYKRLPKRGEHNPFSYVYDNVLLAEVEAYVRLGKLDPRSTITMKHMYDAGLLEKKAYNRNGVALLAKAPSAWKRARLERKLGYPLPTNFSIPVDLEVATVSEPAREAIESAGGSVRRVYYNKLGMRALLLPEWFAKKGRLLPRAVQMVPYKKQWRYDRVGTLPPPAPPADFGRVLSHGQAAPA